MYLDYTPEQKQLRDHLRKYFTDMMTPELRAELTGSEGGGPLYHKALQKMGADGWIGIGWPKEYGGQGRSPIEQFIFSDEVQRTGFPLPFLTINSVGNTIMQFGTEEQKKDFLPRILRGTLHAAIGYTEPEAGTDLASLRTRAVKDGDDYVINGSKVFTSLANYADYIWLAARTDPDAPKHSGISIFMVDTKLPGFKLTPIWTMSGVRTNATYFEDVRETFMFSPLISLVLTVLPPVYYPLSRLPAWAQLAARFSPTTYAAGLVQGAVGLPGPALTLASGALDWGVLGAVTGALFALAAFKARWKEP